MLLNPNPKVPTRLFDYDRETKTFLADASDLGWPVGYPPLERVYDDACDEGFTITSHRTTAEVVLVQVKVDRSPDYAGGWRMMEFVPAGSMMTAEEPIFRVVVFND